MKCDTIKLPAALRADLDAATAPTERTRWTPEMDAALMGYSKKLSYAKLAEILTTHFMPVSRSSCRERATKIGARQARKSASMKSFIAACVRSP